VPVDHFDGTVLPLAWDAASFVDSIHRHLDAGLLLQACNRHVRGQRDAGADSDRFFVGGVCRCRECESQGCHAPCECPTECVCLHDALLWLSALWTRAALFCLIDASLLEVLLIPIKQLPCQLARMAAGCWACGRESVACKGESGSLLSYFRV